MSYTPINTLFFEPSLSNGTENDRITSFLNLPAVLRISQKHLNLILKNTPITRLKHKNY
jgi:hypothetical protein